MKPHLGLRQNSFMARTAVMKLFCVYLAPYSRFFRTARTEFRRRDIVQVYIFTGLFAGKDETKTTKPEFVDG